MTVPVRIDRLNSIMGILGTTKASLWPFLESAGITVAGLSIGDLIPSETAGAAEALEDDFNPVQHPGGIYSYHFNPTGDHHLAGVDAGDYSFATGGFSVGAFIMPNAIASNGIVTKYNSAGNAEEYRFWLDAAGKISLELHDASASATETAQSDSAVTLHRGIFAAATYDGTAATPSIFIYKNGVRVNNGASTESGTFSAMEAGTAPLLIGAGGVTATPTTEFHGRIALPFLTGKELSEADMLALWNIYRDMLGLP